ncbi:MAG: adenosylcobinamide-GDP ribazoletransferase [Hyphomicrobium sp.]|uniref:adenosylcobinamide-GDP ribazoletransferase n=1 Tax=Hyphomicrobium sp. TaxID=82 RepID=UPI0039E3D507
MIANEARLFLIALQFLTRIRITAIDPFPDDWLPRSSKYMPLVGALIGAVVGLLVIASFLFFPAPVPVVIGLAASLLLTGALHEDGLADTLDAFGGGGSRERCLEIMKDSRIGIYGALALIVVLALKAASLAAIDPISIARVLIAAYAGGRFAAVAAMTALPYAGGDNVKVSRAPALMTAKELGLALAFAVLAGFFALGMLVFVVATIAAVLAAAVIALIARKKIGGYTGDVLGAVEQIYEVTFIAVAAAMIAGPG